MILSPEGEKQGYVKEALLTRDLSSLACLVAVDGEEEEFYLPARAVSAVKDAVIASKARAASPSGVAAPMGRAVFTEQGEYLGTVADMELGREPALVVGGGEAARSIPLTRVAVGETVIVFSEARPKRPRPRKSPSSPSPKSANRPAGPSAPIPPKSPTLPPEGDPSSRPSGKGDRISGGRAPSSSSPTLPPEGEPSSRLSGKGDRMIMEPFTAMGVPAGDGWGWAPSHKSANRPARLPTLSGASPLNRCNLLGKRVKRSVFDAFGFPVALAGERITPELLNAARRRNLLLALTVNTLTNIP